MQAISKMMCNYSVWFIQSSFFLATNKRQGSQNLLVCSNTTDSDTLNGCNLHTSKFPPEFFILTGIVLNYVLKKKDKMCRIIFNWKTSDRWSDGWFHICSVACCVVNVAILDYSGTTCETMATGTKLNIRLFTGNPCSVMWCQCENGINNITSH